MLRHRSWYRLPGFLVAATLAAAAGVLPAAGGQDPLDDLPWLRRAPQPPPVYPEILVAAEDVHGALPVDARSEDAFRRGHLPGAVRPSLEACAAEPECLRRNLGSAGVRGTEPVVVYGDAAQPAAVGQLFWLLHRAGVAEVRVLTGGMEAWQAAGGPLETGDARRRTEVFRAPAPPPGPDRGWLATRFGTAEAEVVDVRGEALWASEGGHVPHSLPYDFAALLAPDGGPAGGAGALRWPEPEAARLALGRLGPRRGTYVNLGATFVVYGEGPDDHRAGLGFLLLRLAGLEAKVYAGGWADWIAAPESPRVQIVSTVELAALLEPSNPGLTADRPAPDLPVFDVRGELDHAAGHLPGAISLPAQLCAERFPEAVPPPAGGGDRFATPLAFYCYGRTCIRSRDCSTAAARAGFRILLWLRDGVPAWQQAGLPLFRSQPGEDRSADLR